MTARRRMLIGTDVEIVAKMEHVKLNDTATECTKAASMTHLIIVVVVGTGCTRQAHQQRPPQRAAQQANMQTHCTPITPYTSR